MAVDIGNLIAAISPDVYCSSDPSTSPGDYGTPIKTIVKKTLEEGFKNKSFSTYLDAAKKAKLKASEFMEVTDLSNMMGAFDFKALKNPVERHEILYEVQGGSLEPIYFWLLDYLKKEFGKHEKIVDTFMASAGSAHFAEMGGRATRMQEEAMKLLGLANTVIKSILNVLYDLKEFKLRLEIYDEHDSDDPNKRMSALLSLKQIWMDSVDIKKGTTSLKGLIQQFDYATIIDAFMASNSLEDVNKLDLNDRVKRILLQRMGEFLRWIKESETELRKRYEIEKTYLRSQVNTVKLYARWAKPYLKAAKQLEQQGKPDSALVTTFNTTIMELVVMGIKRFDPLGDVSRGELPSIYKDLVRKGQVRTYNNVLIAELKFTGIPERFSQQGGYGFRGRVEILFTGYVLNDDELKTFKQELERDDLQDIMGSVEGTTEKSLSEIQDDIEQFLGEKPLPEKSKKNKSNEDTNPFSALFSFGSSSSEKKEEKKSNDNLPKKIKPDTDYEKAIRNSQIVKARRECKKVYSSFKGNNGMPTLPVGWPN